MKKQLAIAPYIELTKPRITYLVLVTATLGYYLGGEGARLRELLFFLIGIGMVTSGSSTLNNYLEREVDKKMELTKNRPIPSGRLEPDAALSFGIFLTLTGLFILCLFSNLLTSFLCLLAAFLYILVYTPLKKVSWINTTMGAIPGAIPPLAGWTAATNQIEWGGITLFLILFLWQHPHFYAIAWMYKEDYKNAGFKMLSSVDSTGKHLFFQAVFFSILLIPISVLPTWIGLSGKIYFVGAIFLGFLFLRSSLQLMKNKTFESAKGLLKTSIIYLPLLLLLIIIDKGLPY